VNGHRLDERDGTTEMGSMTPDVESLIREGETLDVEFKGESRGPLPDDDLVAAVVCLANRPSQAPGWLLLGVEDDGTVTGARPRHGPVTDPRRLQALIANRTVPSLTCRVTVLSVRGQPVVAIEVPPSPDPVGTADGRYLRRTIGGRGRPECRPFHFHEMPSRVATLGRLDPATAVVPDARWDDLDPLEFERFRRFVRESGGAGDQALAELPDLELAKALGAVEANHEVTAVRTLGLLLFGREEALRRWLPTHEVAFQVLSGTQVLTNEFSRAPLLRVMEELLARFRARNRETELQLGLIRVGIPDYPERAFREGLANACVHRDYARLGAIHVQWYDDRLVISSPGGFPEGVRLQNLLVTPPRPRSPLLADAFKRAGIVERTARGIDTIFYEQVRNGHPAPSYDLSTETDVVLVLQGGEADLPFVRLVASEEARRQRPFTLEELLVLHRVWSTRRATVGEAAETIQRPKDHARAVLEHLVEAGLLEARGTGRGRTYLLSAGVHRQARTPSASARARGFDRLQQEAMILQYVESHGHITRREAAELCRLTPAQAYQVLRELTRRGRLRAVGQGRGAAYERNA
jgi:ATP-dependent DNA helicase RecG